MRAWKSWAAGLAVGLLGCAAHGARVSAPSTGRQVRWQYAVVVDQRLKSLQVDAWLPPGSLADLTVRRGAEPFVEDVEVEVQAGWRSVSLESFVFHVSECARGCHVRYRFALREAAEMLRDVDMAIAWGEVMEASPSMWLLRPALAPAGTRFRFHVDAPEGVSFATGTFADEDAGASTYEADASNIAAAPYAAFGPLHTHRIEAAAGAQLDVAIAPGRYAVSDDALLSWVSRSARTTARYLGCFPVERALILVVPARGGAVGHGATMGDGGASIVVEVGSDADEEALREDWVLPHEMAHLAVPSLPPRHHWMEEGVAVYVQPIARARAGELAPEVVWREFALRMPEGASKAGEGGLDDTPSWARTYWGGAAFCLLADVRIRQLTDNRLGFEDAMRGWLASGGSVAQIWDFGRLLDTADAWVGGSVLRSLHVEMGAVAGSLDLPRLFRDLGVVVEGDDIRLVDDAPLSALRRAITAPLPADGPAPAACRWVTAARLAQR